MIFQKNILFSDLTAEETASAKKSMLDELDGLNYNHPLRDLFIMAWEAYKSGVFMYDGATFVKERFRQSIFELAAFIHDYRNSLGYVGKRIDREMFDVMIRLNYPIPFIIRRWFMTRLTFFNVLRHRCRGSFCNELPTNIYKLSNY